MKNVASSKICAGGISAVVVCTFLSSDIFLVYAYIYSKCVWR